MKTQQLFRFIAATILATALPASSLTIPPTLRDEITGREIADGTRNLVICIHGWNPAVLGITAAKTDKYTQESEWVWLVFNMRQALPGSSSDPWSLLLYHWEEDANTGFFDPLQLGYYWQLTGNAARSAQFAWEHGISLGARLPSSLRRVHIIAHSAGAWCAYQTASALLANPYLIVQVTLLDPYVPDEVPGLQGSYPTLSKATIKGMANWPSGFSTRFSVLENYFADDSTIGIPNILVNPFPFPTPGTQTTFSWRPQDINQQVDWSFSAYPYRIGADLYYDWHSGPILFYGDTIKAANGGSIEPGLPSGGLPFDYNLNGWKQSLFYKTQFGLLTRITTQPQRTTTIASGASVTLSVAATSLLPFTFQWFKRGQDSPISGATFGYYTFTASSANAGDYVVRVRDSNGNLIFSDFATVGLTTGPPPPTTFNVAASSGPNGSISPNGTFARNVGSSVTLTAAATSGYEIDRWYVNGLVAQTGGASYTILNLQANTAVQVTFRSTATTPITGDLLVNITPQAAVNAGAQWRFVSLGVGNYQTPNVLFQDLGPGQYQINFKPVSSYTTPSDQTVNVVAGQTANVTGNYVTLAPSTYTLTLNTSNPDAGGATASPLASGNIYTAGAVVQLTAYANYGYHFTGWSGALGGSVTPTTIIMDGSKSVTANFTSGDDRLGTMTLTIQPPAAAAAGVQWGWSADDYRNSGTSVAWFPGTYIFTIHPVDGWLGPNQKVVTLTAGQTTNVTVTFMQDTTPGLLTVTLSPPDAVAAGAKWRVSGGAAQASGATVSLPPGTNYAVTFDGVSGWTAPASRTVTVQRSQTAVVAGNYTPPAGQPAIGAIHPSFGALAGGTALTIEGVNFTAPATVLVGGKPATNSVVLGSTQIACLTPSSSVYGTVPVVVQVAGGNATNANGFSYGVERGSGIELVSAVGGAVSAAAVQGNYAYIGEGSSFVVADVSNPASPLPIGRVAMPGMVNDIALCGSYAFVANDDAGLQVVDLSTPSAPKLVGFYDTPGVASGVAVSGTNAFVADGDGGLMTFDI